MDKSKPQPCTYVMRRYIKMMEQKLCFNKNSEEYNSTAHARKEHIKCVDGKLHTYDRYINWADPSNPNIMQMSTKKWISKKHCVFSGEIMADSEITIDFKITDSKGKEIESNIFQRAREYCKVWKYNEPWKVLEEYSNGGWTAVSCRADKVFLQRGSGVDYNEHHSYSGVGHVSSVEDITESIPSMKPSKKI